MMVSIFTFLQTNKWQKETPDWAREHKAIIVHRIKKSFPAVDSPQIVEYDK